MKTSEGGTLNPEATFYDDGSPFIEHYGVLGMKWGVRNAESQARANREKRAKKARKVEQRNLKTKRKAAKASRKAQRGINRERVKTINEERLEANRNRALLSDAELNRRIARLQKERQLNQLTQEELQPGRTAVKRALTNAGTETLKGETKSLIKKGKKRATKVAANKVSFGVRGPHVGSASRVHIE